MHGAAQSEDWLGQQPRQLGCFWVLPKQLTRPYSCKDNESGFQLQGVVMTGTNSRLLMVISCFSPELQAAHQLYNQSLSPSSSWIRLSTDHISWCVPGASEVCPSMLSQFGAQA